MSRVYISGPISNLPRAAYLGRFNEAERLLKQKGYEVLNPTKLAPCRWLFVYNIIGYKLTLLYDMWHLMNCDQIFMLPDYFKSRGARTEYLVASALGIGKLPLGDRTEITNLIEEFIERENI